MVHFEVILGSGVRSVSRLIFFLPTNVQLLFQYHLLKRLYVLQEGVENPRTHHLPDDKYLQSKNQREQLAH